ncbi:hypothetical protein C8R44DRAFT_879249 [Mycena epipterygia]|nr:hypothetical protein C8R44DRAFT_879249 [Mycena epipterygia]
MSLTPQQKAAKTRAANRARIEQEELALQNSVHGLRSAKANVLSEPGVTSKKRAAADTSESTKMKQAKKNAPRPAGNAKTQRKLPPDIDVSDPDDGSNARRATPAPVKKATAAKVPTKVKSAGPNPLVSRTLQNPVALAKPVPPPTREDHEEQSSEGEEESRDPNELQEEEPEEDEDVSGDQLMYETPHWVPGDDHDGHSPMDVDVPVYDFDEYESGSVSSKYDTHIPTSASERESDVDDDDEEVPRRAASHSYVIHSNDEFLQGAPPRRASWSEFEDDDEKVQWRAKGPTPVTHSDDDSPQPVQRRISRTRPTAPVTDEEEPQANARISVQKQRNNEPEAGRRREPQTVPRHGSAPPPHREQEFQKRKPEHTSGQRHQPQPLRQTPREREQRREHQTEARRQPQPQPKAPTTRFKSSDKPQEREIPPTCKERAIREQPIWSAEASYSARVTGKPWRTEARSMKEAVTLPSPGWPTTPTLVFTHRGVLNIGAQDPRIQTLIRNSFNTITGDALFFNDFPDIGDRLQYARNGIYSTSKTLGYTDITARLLDDDVYSKEIAKVADGRWTDLRRSFKTAAIPATIHAFDLKVGCSQRVQALLASPHNDYIYPIKDGVPDYAKPFGNPAIITTIHQTLFSGKRPLATVYQARFPLSDGPHPERMMGKVIACIAASAVCATLQEWQGPVHISNEFNANLFAETYLVHIGFLEQMEQRSPVGYQKVLTRLYREASGQGRVIAHRAATGANALAHLNFADLEAASD